jgi:hypothetical protein
MNEELPTEQETKDYYCENKENVLAQQCKTI